MFSRNNEKLGDWSNDLLKFVFSYRLINVMVYKVWMSLLLQPFIRLASGFLVNKLRASHTLIEIVDDLEMEMCFHFFFVIAIIIAPADMKMLNQAIQSPYRV